ncbi:MAG: YeeE/YedE thiosulfate transporter family protein [bacterium]
MRGDSLPDTLATIVEGIEMEGPLSLVLNLGHATEMSIAVLVGAGFGFVLERAGFGRADNLAAIFYGRDFRVLRVMFTAIVTGMIGLYWLDLAGVMPLSSIGILDTFLLPQLVGGLLLGAGFIGYCPGTSIVAAVSGKIDGLLFVFGILAGSALFTLNYASLEKLYSSGAMGRILLGQYLHIPSGIMVFAVAVMAIGAFYAASKVENMVARSASE